MRSYSPDSKMETPELRQYLADTDIGPAEMFDLALVYSPDPSAVAVLCEHAAGSFRLLAGVCAARQYVRWYRPDQPQFYLLSREREVYRIFDASEADLLEGLDTARAVAADGCIRHHQPSPHYISGLFAREAHHEALTDRVIAEMSVWNTRGLSPMLGHETRRRNHRTPLVDLYVSQFLLREFGEHAPSWEMLHQMYIPEARIGDVVDLVVAVEQSR